jgi:hypothetical protein
MAVPSKRAGQNGGREAKVKMQEGIVRSRSVTIRRRRMS